MRFISWSDLAILPPLSPFLYLEWEICARKSNLSAVPKKEFGTQFIRNRIRTPETKMMWPQHSPDQYLLELLEELKWGIYSLRIDVIFGEEIKNQ